MSIKENISQAGRGQWMKWGGVTLLYLAFLLWVKSWLGLLVLPLIFDAYISHLLPWGFWRQAKSETVRFIMGWVDALVFALVAVYFVNLYVPRHRSRSLSWWATSSSSVR